MGCGGRDVVVYLAGGQAGSFGGEEILPDCRDCGDKAVREEVHLFISIDVRPLLHNTTIIVIITRNVDCESMHRARLRDPGMC